MASSLHTSGGYEFDFVDVVPRKYECNICNNVLRDACLTECCGQNFCDSCLKRWLSSARGKETCPHCRAVNFRSMRNLEKIREIMEFRIRCVFRKKGCQWEGKLEDLEGHLQSDQGCIYKPIKCQNVGFKFSTSQRFSGNGLERVKCGATMERRNLTDHQRNECKFRQYPCQHCGYTDTYDAIAGTGHIRNEHSKVGKKVNHYRECGRFPVECPNKCAVGTIQRKDLRNHIRTCPLEPLDCQFITVGCKLKIQRKDMDHHCKECMQVHLQLVLHSYNKLARKNAELVLQNQQLTRRMEENNNELRTQIQTLQFQGTQQFKIKM